MTERLQDTVISVVQNSDDSRWYMMLEYEDGEVYVSRVSFDTEARAEQAARAWALENHVSETIN